MKDHAVKILYPPLNSSSNSPGAVIPAVTQLQLIHITDAPRSHSSCFSLTHAPRPLVLYPLHHLHHFLFLQCVFLRRLSRLEAQGSGIVSLFCWDILMRLNIFPRFTSSLSAPSYFLAHFIFCLFVLILILILYMFSLIISSFSTPHPNLLAVSATCSPVHLFSFIRTDLLLWLSDTFSRCTAQCN